MDKTILQWKPCRVLPAGAGLKDRAQIYVVCLSEGAGLPLLPAARGGVGVWVPARGIGVEHRRLVGGFGTGAGGETVT